MLKKALEDPYPSIRCTAARLLGFFGDNSGLERMRADLKEFSQGGADSLTMESIVNRPKGPLSLLQAIS
jgi:hypothetical protein